MRFPRSAFPALVAVFSLTGLAQAEMLTTATIDARHGEIYECTAVNSGFVVEDVVISIIDSSTGLSLAGGSPQAIQPGQAGSETLAIGFLTPKQAHCEISALNSPAEIRASFKRLNSVRQQLEDSDGRSALPGVSAAAQYIPFNAAMGPDAAVCDVASVPGPGSRTIVFESLAPFILSSIRVQPKGVDSDLDRITVTSPRADGVPFTGSFPDATGSSAFTPFPNPDFDVLGGLPAVDGLFFDFPRELASKGAGGAISFGLNCDAAGGTSDIVIDWIQISGWRRQDSPVTIRVQ